MNTEISNSTPEDRIRDLQSLLEAAGKAMERDRTLLSKALGGLEAAIKLRAWLLDGRGCYEWDDDRYRDEFSHAIDEIVKATDPLRKVAGDWIGCPMTAVDIEAARTDWKTKAEQYKSELIIEREMTSRNEGLLELGYLALGSLIEKESKLFQFLKDERDSTPHNTHFKRHDYKWSDGIYIHTCSFCKFVDEETERRIPNGIPEDE